MHKYVCVSINFSLFHQVFRICRAIQPFISSFAARLKTVFACVSRKLCRAGATSFDAKSFCAGIERNGTAFILVMFDGMFGDAPGQINTNTHSYPASINNKFRRRSVGRRWHSKNLLFQPL